MPSQGHGALFTHAWLPNVAPSTRSFLTSEASLVLSAQAPHAWWSALQTLQQRTLQLNLCTCQAHHQPLHMPFSHVQGRHQTVRTASDQRTSLLSAAPVSIPTIMSVLLHVWSPPAQHKHVPSCRANTSRSLPPRIMPCAVSSPLRTPGWCAKSTGASTIRLDDEPSATWNSPPQLAATNAHSSACFHSNISTCRST